MNQENKKNIFKEATTYFFIIVFIILIRTFIVTPIRVNGQSMYNTLEDKEIMILDKISYKFSDIKRFDIVVVDYTNKYTGKKEKLIKRVIGLPGEKMSFKDNTLYINDEPMEESFIKEKTADFDISYFKYDVIPDDCYMVLGDNRNNSTDSRIIGCIPKEKIMGKANLVIFPFSKFGIKQ